MEKESRRRIEDERLNREHSEIKKFNKEFNNELPSQALFKFLRQQHPDIQSYIISTMTTQELHRYSEYSARFLGDRSIESKEADRSAEESRMNIVPKNPKPSA